MSLDQKIQLWNAIGTWFAGFATFAAVLVSLYLSRQGSKVKLKAYVGLRLLVGAGQPRDELLVFSVANIGERPVTITNIGWVIGRGADRRYALQLFGSSLSATIPQTLAHGQRSEFIVSFREHAGWLESFAKDMLKTNEPGALDSLTVQIFTTVEQTVMVKPERAFLLRLSEAFDAHLKP